MPADHVSLRFLRPHAAYRKGSIITYPRGPAKSLLLAGICELVREELPLVETAAMERRAETADNPRRRRK